MTDIETAPESMTVDELTRAIGAVRAARDLVDTPAKLTVRPHQPVIAIRETTSRNGSWCKVAADGFTSTRRPSMRIQTRYDTVTSTPVQRTWHFLDQFSARDDEIENWTVQYPCLNLERIARDITRAWQVYCTPGLDILDAALLANTPLNVSVDGIAGDRYLDIWTTLRQRGDMPSSRRWRVVRGAIRSQV